MPRNDNLRAEADRRGKAFFKSASTLSERMRPVKLLNEAVAAFDPDFVLLNRLKAGVQRNPFALLAAAGGLWLLSLQLTRRNQQKSVTRQGMRPLRLPPATLKGDENGYNNDTKRH